MADSLNETYSGFLPDLFEWENNELKKNKWKQEHSMAKNL